MDVRAGYVDLALLVAKTYHLNNVGMLILNKSSMCAVDRLMMEKTLSRLVAYVLAVGGALLLLCTCAEGEHPQATATGTSPVATTAVPTDTSLDLPLPGPPSAGEPAGDLLTASPTVTDSGPPDADLAIQASEFARLAPDGTIVYTLTLRNDGPGLATGVLLTNQLPRGMTPHWTQPAEPVCQRAGRDVGCDVGDLQGGDSATVVLDLSARESETVVDLAVPTCEIGQESNQPQITCRLSRLRSGAEAQVQIGVHVDAPLTASGHYTASIGANEADPNPANNDTTFVLKVGSTGETPVAEGVAGTSTDLVVQANGPSVILVGQPFTYTYTITNRGALAASHVRFEDALPSDLELVTYTPGLPRCEQRDDVFTCLLPDLDGEQVVTFTLVITGHAEQPVRLDLDPLLPGWPICYVIKERTWLHVVYCELGSLLPGQAAQVQLVLSPIGVQERTTANAASVSASETDLNPADNTITTTLTVQAQVKP